MTTGGTRGAGHAGFPGLSENAQQPLDHCPNRGFVGGGKISDDSSPCPVPLWPPRPLKPLSRLVPFMNNDVPTSITKPTNCQKIRYRLWLCCAKRQNRTSIGVLSPNCCRWQARGACSIPVTSLYSMSRVLTGWPWVRVSYAAWIRQSLPEYRTETQSFLDQL